MNISCCPKCARTWEGPCEQSVCIDLFGECIPCRFLPIGDKNKYGSGNGTEEELNIVTITNIERNKVDKFYGEL